jgi:hypothetical protein
MDDDTADVDEMSAGCTSDDDLAVTFDEQGHLVGERQAACRIDVLNGSWFVQFTPRPQRTLPGGPPVVSSPVRLDVRGALRIEVGAAVLRASGDVYVHRSTSPFPPVLPTTGRWYPQFPEREYSWYLRSTGATYARGTLRFTFERHLWDASARDFVSSDRGEIVLTCRRPLRTIAGTPVTMTGRATIGGRDLDVVATKTSTSYRGCAVEVDVMTGRNWPTSARSCAGVGVTFQKVYRTAGWDTRVRIDELAVPDDASLTAAELQALLATHRAAAMDPTAWRLWILVGSSQGTTFGIMFDDDAVPREGVVGFADVRFGNQSFIEATARNQPLGQVPLAFLRTLTHEAGHAFNLFHPKHDVHVPPVGRSVMNQTGDVMGFATTTDPYPCNATMDFDEHSRTSLIHSPDPQVKPGWLPFGWGHGSATRGMPEPVDVAGLGGTDAESLRLEVRLPVEAHLGEYLFAEVTVTNVGDAASDVTARLTLAQGDLELRVRRPNGVVDHVRDIVLACGPRPTATLAPNASITGRMQVFFTNVGFAFDDVGTYEVFAELDTGDGVTTVRSQPAKLHIRPPAEGTESDVASITLDRGVGQALALGDFGQDDAARERLVSCATSYGATDTGAACALALANSLGRSFTNYATDEVRPAEQDEADRYLQIAADGRSAPQLMKLATTVASPIERDAPVVEAAFALADSTSATMSTMADDAEADEGVDEVQAILDDFRRPLST